MPLGLQIGEHLTLADSGFFDQWLQHRNALGLPVGVLFLFSFLIRRMTRSSAPSSGRRSSGSSGTPFASVIISILSITLLAVVIYKVTRPTSPDPRQAGLSYSAQRPAGAPSNPGQPRGQVAPALAASTSSGLTGTSRYQDGSIAGGEARRAAASPAGAMSEDLQSPNGLSAGAGSTPASRSAHFSLGSSRADVIAVQGKPDSETDRILVYGRSRVLLDGEGYVTAWVNSSDNLIVK
jgi:hypothetical protein